jgi:hypothetical protein
MSTLLTASEDVIHGVIGAMRFIATAGATRPFVGPEAEMVKAMALTFESARSGLAIGGPVLAPMATGQPRTSRCPNCGGCCPTNVHVTRQLSPPHSAS